MAKKYLSLERLQEYDALLKAEIDEKINANKVIVDSELSSSSENPVQNKIIDAEFDAIAVAMDALEQSVDTKVNISDIIDNLTTSDISKALSANQGFALKVLIDALQNEVNSKANSNHGHVVSDIENLESVLGNKAEQESLNAHTSDKDIHITSSERTSWNAIENNVKTYTDNAVAQKTLVQIITWGADE